MKILFSARQNDPLWLEVSKLLIEEKKYEYFIASHNKPIIENEIFEERFVDLCVFNDLERNLNWDKLLTIQDYISPEKYLFLKGIYANATSRCGIKRIGPLSHDIKFNKLVIRLLNFLIIKKIDIIGFDMVPHLPWEMLAWELIRILGGYSFCFKRTGICDAIYIEEELYGNNTSPFFELSKKHPICKCKDNEEINDYIRKTDVSLFQTQGVVKNLEFESNKTKIIFQRIKKYILKKFLFKYFYFSLSALKQSFKIKFKSNKEASSNTTDISILILRDFKSRVHLYSYFMKYIFSSFSNELFLNKLFKRNKAFIKEILQGKYIYFALHLQPESTTFPQSLYWFNVYTAINQIRQKFDNVPILIKEHPRQFMLDLRTYSFRSSDFYKIIDSLHNVYFVDTKYDGLELIKKSFLVAGINGTNLWESLKFGKPTIMLSNQIYSDMENSIKINELKDLNYNLEKIDAITKWTSSKKNQVFINWINKYSSSFVNSGLHWKYVNIFMKSNYKLASKNIKVAILDYCNYKKS